MEDTSFGDLMETYEYLIEDWELDSLCGETNKHNTKLDRTDSNSDQEIPAIKRQPGFELVCEHNRPTKQVKSINESTNNSSASPSSSSSSTTQLISFGDFNASRGIKALNFSNVVETEKFGHDLMPGTKESGRGGGRRQPHLMKEHVIAERKRRQRLNERLIALSALLPDLKKADKVTVLEDAIRHFKRLQERIKQLEEEKASTNKTMESVIFVKKSHVSMDVGDSSCSVLDNDSSEKEGNIQRQNLPLIEARVCNNDMLVRIRCEKSKGCVTKILYAMDKLRLDVVNSFTLPFGNSTFDITILAKIDDSFSQPVIDMVKSIRSAIVE